MQGAGLSLEMWKMTVLRSEMSTSSFATGDDALPKTGVRQDGLQARTTIASVAVLGGIAMILGLELAGILAATGGHMVYSLEALYTHLALAGQVAQGHYGLVPGEAAAPSSSILYPFLLAALSPLGLGSILPAVINIAATIAAGVFALCLATECGIPLHRVAPARLFLLAAAVTLALNLAGLALTGLEHSLHVACTVAYLLGLLRFVRRGRCDWWWFVCIIVQPLIRFEAAGMLVADALIFVSFRRYGYALAMVLIGMALVGGYCLFLHALGLPLLPSSVLARSDWSNAAIGTHRGLVTVVIEILRNFQNNIDMFGASQILGGVAVACLWLGSHPVAGLWRVGKRDQAKLMTIAFMTFVSFGPAGGGQARLVTAALRGVCPGVKPVRTRDRLSREGRRLVRAGHLAADGPVLIRSAADLCGLRAANLPRTRLGAKGVSRSVSAAPVRHPVLPRPGRRGSARLH